MLRRTSISERGEIKGQNKEEKEEEGKEKKERQAEEDKH